VRILFSSTRGVGHARPLLPYARAMRARGLRAGAGRLAAEIAGLHPLDAAVDTLLGLGR